LNDSEILRIRKAKFKIQSQLFSNLLSRRREMAEREVVFVDAIFRLFLRNG